MLALAGSSPLVLEAQFGQGKVVLVTTPLNQDWNTLARTNFYLPMVQSMVRFLAAGSARNLNPGESIIARFDDLPAGAPRSAQIVTPSDATQSVALQSVGDAFQARFNDTSEPGVYTVTAGGKTFHFVVGADRQEADLTPLTQQQWKTFSDVLGFKMIDAAQGQITTSIGDDRSPRELWAMVLLAVLVLAIAEVLLEGRFTRPAHEPDPELAL